MGKEPPFDAWDGEDLQTTEVVDDAAAEEVAMHVEPDGPVTDPAHWSELTSERNGDAPDERPVTYFEDEQPEQAVVVLDVEEEPEPDIEQLLERQHYAFPPTD